MEALLFSYATDAKSATDSYSIVFDLNVKEYDTDEERDEAFGNDNSGEGNKFRNAFMFPGRYGRTVVEKGNQGGGYNSIQVKNGETSEKRKTYAHEIGHALGLDHFTDGLMEEGSSRGEGDSNNFVTPGNVSRMLLNAGIGNLYETSTDKQLAPKSRNDKAKLRTTGVAPSSNFNRGVVKPTIENQ
jgi:hypothetical protein